MSKKNSAQVEDSPQTDEVLVGEAGGDGPVAEEAAQAAETVIEAEKPAEPPKVAIVQDEKPAKAPEPPEEIVQATGPKKLRIINTNQAGRTVYSVSGKPCVFDGEGIAEVGVDDFAHLTQVPGYSSVE